MAQRENRFRLWRPLSEQKVCNYTNKDDRSTRVTSAINCSKYLEEDFEFHRIRNIREVGEILKTRRKIASAGDDDGDDSENDSEVHPVTVSCPPLKPFVEYMNSSLVVGEQVALTAILLGVHREILDFEGTTQRKADFGNCLIEAVVIHATLLLLLYYIQRSLTGLESPCDLGPFIAPEKGFEDKSRKGDHNKKHARIRAFFLFCDVVLLPSTIRIISVVVRILALPHSTDTIYALTMVGMLVHLIVCDYGYANGSIRLKDSSRPSSPAMALANLLHYHPRSAFLGRTLSLNAVFFSTTLLAARILSNAISYAFVSSAVILFALYPNARHRIALKYPNRINGSPCVIITLALFFLAWLMISPAGRLIFVSTQTSVIVVTPFIQWWSQQYKRIISGPWDIAHISLVQNNSTAAKSGSLS